MQNTIKISPTTVCACEQTVLLCFSAFSLRVTAFPYRESHSYSLFECNVLWRITRHTHRSVRTHR